MKELIEIVKKTAKEFYIEPAVVLSFIEVETGGKGFADNGKILIQFEPVWFKKQAPFAPSGKWSVNKVDVQSKEWEAFNDAFASDPLAAMKSTSIGLGQIMGFHYNRLGYDSIGQMWDDAKKGIDRQIWQICKFIATDTHLFYALKVKAWNTVASIYNGSGYKALAVKLGRVPYDESMKQAYNKYKNI